MTKSISHARVLTINGLVLILTCFVLRSASVYSSSISVDTSVIAFKTSLCEGEEFPYDNILQMWGDVNLFEFQSFCFADSCLATCEEIDEKMSSAMDNLMDILDAVQNPTNYSNWGPKHLDLNEASDDMSKPAGFLSIETYNYIQKEKRKALNKFVKRISDCVVSEIDINKTLDFEITADQLYGKNADMLPIEGTIPVRIKLSGMDYPHDLYTTVYQSILHELLHVEEHQVNKAFRIFVDKDGNEVDVPFDQKFSEEIWVQEETYNLIDSAHAIEPRYLFQDQTELLELISDLRDNLIKSKEISQDDDYSDAQLEAYFEDELGNLGANELLGSPPNPNYDIKQKIEPCSTFHGADDS
ncbi:MAG: hypothetical protein F4039_03625 [Gammaproteobacteria bacterium]|nr:hypothetical protein [Gammaproteobacteria bacterium]